MHRPLKAFVTRQTRMTRPLSHYHVKATNCIEHLYGTLEVRSTERSTVFQLI